MHTTSDFFNGKGCTYEWLIQLKILHFRNHTPHSAIKSDLWTLDIFDITQRTRYYIVKLFPVFRNHQRTCITYAKEHIDNILVLSLILFRGTVAELARKALLLLSKADTRSSQVVWRRITAITRPCASKITPDTISNEADLDLAKLDSGDHHRHIHGSRAHSQ